MAISLPNNSRVTGLVWIITIQFMPSTAAAVDDLSIVQYIPNYVTLDYGRDNDDGRSTFLYANLGITLKDRLLVGMGTQVETVAQSEEALDNKNYLLGYSYLPSYRSQVGGEYEYWGDSAKVTINSMRAVLAFNAGKFAITVTPEFRQIKVNNDSQCEKSIDSSAAKIDLSFDVSEEYTFNVGYVAYDYSNNLTTLVECVSNAERLEIQSRIESVANDTESTIGLDYYRNNETFGFSLTRSKSALNFIKTRSLSIYVSTDRFDDWTLTATTGISENLDDSTTSFVSGTITYYW